MAFQLRVIGASGALNKPGAVGCARRPGSGGSLQINPVAPQSSSGTGLSDRVIHFAAIQPAASAMACS